MQRPSVAYCKMEEPMVMIASDSSASIVSNAGKVTAYLPLLIALLSIRLLFTT